MNDTHSQPPAGPQREVDEKLQEARTEQRLDLDQGDIEDSIDQQQDQRTDPGDSRYEEKA